MQIQSKFLRIALRVASVALFALLIFGKYKLARAGAAGKILIIGGLLFAVSTTFKADASTIPENQ